MTIYERYNLENPPVPVPADPLAAKLLDELLTFYDLYPKEQQNSTVADAIEYVKRACREQENQPLTLTLARYFSEQDPQWAGGGKRVPDR